ncbi:MAG: hypothetical protein LLG40_09695 [Deltaproteobacteria bacterium]|nr:hypothetical protein [Deltaproteobacteria bacterium]
MSLISYFSSETLIEFLRRSNYYAKQNRNEYSLKIYKAISDLYDWIDCPCNDDCNCKKYKCEKHLVRKKGVTFDDYYKHFLDCYVDSRSHDVVRKGRSSGRGSKSNQATNDIEDDWANISANTSKTHLLCSDWCDPLFESMARNFRPSGDTIYRAKWLSILCFDTFAAYDNGSVALLKRDFKKPPDFFNLMKRIREDIIIHLDKTGKSLQDFRKYDNPSEFFDAIPNDSLRPIGNIIDKLYLTL